MNFQSTINRLLSQGAAIQKLSDIGKGVASQEPQDKGSKVKGNIYDLIPDTASMNDPVMNPLMTPKGYDPREVARRRIEVLGKRKYAQLSEYYARRGEDNGEK